MKVRYILYIVLTIIVVIMFSYICFHTVLDNISKVTSLGVLISLYGILIVNIQNNEKSRKEVLYKKAEFTNHFVTNFRNLMPGMNWCEELARKIYESDKKLEKLFNEVKIMDLNFTTEEFEALIKKHNLTLNELNDLMDKHFDNIEEITDFAYFQNKLTGHIRVCEFDECYEKFQNDKVIIHRLFKENIDIIDKDFTDDKKEDFLDNLLGMEGYKYCLTIRLNEQNLYNDLECVALNSQFGLIDYNKITDLIYAPYNEFMTVCYIRLMHSVCRAYNEDKDIIFSNIIKLYKEISKCKRDKLDKINKIENRSKKINAGIEQKKQSNGDSID